LLPAERPEEAPPREVAAKSDNAKPEKPGAAPADATTETAEPEVESKPEKPATKKRRQNRRS
jgi:hypothetical protein